jgi:hypothetical protein
MPWDQIVTAAVVVLLGTGGWIYAWRPEPPPRRRRVPPRPRGPQVPLGG